MGRWEEKAAELRAGSDSSLVACVVGGGLCGLALALEFGRRGFAVLIIDPDEPGAAPASSAAAGLLDPLTPKGRVMWRGTEAYDAASRLVLAASALSPDDPCFSETGSLHVATDAKHAAALSSAASIAVGCVATAVSRVDGEKWCAAHAHTPKPRAHPHHTLATHA